MKAMTASAIALAALIAAAGCSDSEPKIGSDTSTTDTPVEPAVPACDELLEWSLEFTGTPAGPGALSVQVDLLCSVVNPTCAGPPCLVVTTPDDGGSAGTVTHESTTRATFTYTNTEIGPDGSAQFFLRWRVLCVAAAGEEERVVTASPRVCADSSTNLSLSPDPCP